MRAECALSPATASGPVRGRPTGPGTRIMFRTGMNCGLSPACPAVILSERGRHCGTQDKCVLVVSPPWERPRSAAASRALLRRRARRRSSRSGSVVRLVPHRCPFFRGGLLHRVQGLGLRDHPCGIMMGPDRGRVHAGQRHVHQAMLRSLGDRPLEHRGEHPGIPPLPKLAVNGGPVPESLGQLPPFRPVPEPPHDALEVRPQILRVRPVLTDRQEWGTNSHSASES